MAKLISKVRSLRETLELGKGTATKKTVVLLLSGVLVLQAIFIWSYVGALHKPAPLGVPLGITGLEPVADTIETKIKQSGNEFSPQRYASRSAAQQALAERKIPAYLVAGASGDTLVVSEATSSFLAVQLPVQVAMLEPAARNLNIEKQFVLPESDPRGLSPFYVVVGWVIGGYLAATLIGLAIGDRARSLLGGLKRLGILAGFSLAGGILGAVIVQKFIGVLGGNFLELALAGTLVTFTAAMVTSGLQSVFGILGTSLAILVLVALGNPGSGGPLLNELLMPGPWRSLGTYLPAFSATDLVRSISYFNGGAVLRDITILASFSITGASAALFFRSSRKHRYE